MNKRACQLSASKLPDTSPRTRRAGNLPDRRILTVHEAAQFLNVSASFLNKARVTGGAGGGPRYIKFSPSSRGRVGYELADLEHWLDSKKRNHTSELKEVEQ